MRRVFVAVECIVVVTFLFHALSVHANDGPLTLMGGTPSLLETSHPTIRMDSEDVKIQLGEDTYVVDAVFHFYNTGPTVTQLVGFPKRGMGTEWDFRTSDYVSFETWVNGAKVDFLEEPWSWWRTFRHRWRSLWVPGMVKDERWLVKRVKFPSASVTVTRVRYKARYVSMFDGRVLFYVVGTGRPWKGPIGKARFTIDASSTGGVARISVRTAWPYGAKVTTTKYFVRCEATNWEPSSPDAQIIIVLPLSWDNPTRYDPQ